MTAALAAASIIFRNQNDTQYSKQLLDKAQEVGRGWWGDGLALCAEGGAAVLWLQCHLVPRPHPAGLSLPETPAPAPCPLLQVYSFSKELKGKFSDGDFNLTVRRCRHLHPRHP